MKEAFTKIIKSIILPEYEIISYVMVGLANRSRFQVYYKIPPRTHKDIIRKIEETTHDLFKMLSLNNDYTLAVWFDYD